MLNSLELVNWRLKPCLNKNKASQLTNSPNINTRFGYCWKADEEILDQREAIDTALARLALVAMEQKDEVSRLRLRESFVCPLHRGC
jgi:hypothetical protein